MILLFLREREPEGSEPNVPRNDRKTHHELPVCCFKTLQCHEGEENAE